MTVTRQDIATALSEVDDVKGSEFRPSVLGAGDAWAQVASHDRADGSFFMTGWAIYIVLSADERTAVKWFDDHIEDIRDALEDVVYVERDEPAVIPTDAGDLFALLITARSE